MEISYLESHQSPQLNFYHHPQVINVKSKYEMENLIIFIKLILHNKFILIYLVISHI